MTLKKQVIKIFNRNGFRWIIVIIFRVVSFYKTRTTIRLKYDSLNNKWMQFQNNICYYIDTKPNWGISIPYMEQYVNERNFVQYHPNEGDIIIDIGAGVGTETIIYSKKVGQGKVYAIEAHPDTYKTLSLLKGINNFENIIISNVAISSKEGLIHIESRDNHVENSIWRNSLNGIPVKAVTLDNYINENKIQKIHFLKMNIEGAEIEAIKGMATSIKIIDYIAISCHDFLFKMNTTEIKDTITNFLTTNNFMVVTQKTGHVVKDSWIYGKKMK